MLCRHLCQSVSQFPTFKSTTINTQSLSQRAAFDLQLFSTMMSSPPMQSDVDSKPQWLQNRPGIPGFVWKHFLCECKCVAVQSVAPPSHACRCAIRVKTGPTDGGWVGGGVAPWFPSRTSVLLGATEGVQCSPTLVRK